MPSNPVPILLSACLFFSCGGDPVSAAEVLGDASPTANVIISNAAAVRGLSPEVAAQGLQVRLRGVATYVFDRDSAFIQDASAGIYVGDGAAIPELTPGDLVTVEGVTGPGQFAPLVRPSSVAVVGKTNLPTPRQVTYEDLVTGSEDSQWVEVRGLVRSVFSETAVGATLEIASGSGRITGYVPGLTEADLAHLVDCEVRITGVCGTWFNKQRQLFGIRLMVPRAENIVVEVFPPTNVLMQAAQPLGSLMRFAPSRSESGRRAKLTGIVSLFQPGQALYVQDEKYGLYVQTRQLGQLQPGDQVEVLGFPAKGDYTPMLEDGLWQKVGSGQPPAPTLVTPDGALGGLQDCRLVAIEGRLLEVAYNDNETLLLLEANDTIFSAHLEAANARTLVGSLQNGSRLRVTGVCRIEVGDRWQAGPAWRAKSFRILMRSPVDVEVIKLPPWWTLPRLLWTVGLLTAAVLAALVWGGPTAKQSPQADRHHPAATRE